MVSNALVSGWVKVCIRTIESPSLPPSYILSRVFHGQLNMLVLAQGHPAEWMSALCSPSCTLSVSCVPPEGSLLLFHMQALAGLTVVLG